MKNIFNKKGITLFVSIIAISIFARTVFAVWSGTFYEPGDTLNPECLPSQTDCDVRAPLTSVNISDTAYGAGWNGDATHAPSKNAIYDKIESLSVGSGTVTSVSVVTANGVSGSVATATTTPAITLTLGAITPTTVNGLTITANGTNTLNIAAGKTLTSSNTLTLAGTDGSTLNIGSGGTLGSNAYTSTAYLPLSGGTLTGNLIFTDNTYDIGASGATRPRTGYFATSVVAPSFVGALTGNASTATALQTARTIGGVSFDGSANITVASATGGFTISGGDLALSTNSITMTGSLGTTGARLTKGWFTDLEVTNAIVGSITGNAATVTTNANLTGPITSSGNATSVASQTGTGSTFVMQASPTLTTPNIGVATATSVNKVAITAPATSATLTIADGKTLTSSNTLTLAGTDGSTLNIGSGGTLGSNAFTSTAYAPLASPIFTGTVTIPTPFTLGATSVTSTGTQLNYLNAATGTTGTTSTNLVFSTSPTLTTPAITTSATLSNNAIGTTSTDGFVLQNTTAAAAGAQQYSPRLRLTGQGWKTNATAASQTTDWIIEARPVQGSANPTVNLAILAQVNGGGYTTAVAPGQILAPGGASSSQVLPQYSAVNNDTYGLRIGGGNGGNAASLVLGSAWITVDANANTTMLKSNSTLRWGNAENISGTQIALSSPSDNNLLLRDSSVSGPGNFIIGSTSTLPGTSGKGVLVMGLGTVPTTSPADVFQIYPADFAAGDTRMYLRTESGTAQILGNNSIGSSPTSGTNQAGTSYTLFGGQGTGNATGGSLIFQTAPAGTTGTSVNALATAMTILGNRNVGIGTTNPQYMLDIQDDGIGSNTFAVGNGSNSYALTVDAVSGVVKMGDVTGAINTTLFTVNDGGNEFTFQNGFVGIGTATPGSLLSVGNGDLFQINSAGQLGSYTAPTSDYIFSLNGNTTNDNSRIIDITQANNANEDTTGIYITNTANTGTPGVSSTRNIRNQYLSLTPTATATNAIIKAISIEHALSLSNTTLGNGSSDPTSVEAFGNKIGITGTPVINNTNASIVNHRIYGTSNTISLTPTLTAVTNVTGDYVGNYNEVTITSGGDAAYTANVYGTYNLVGGNLTTAGGTTHYGERIQVSGTADNNYGIYVSSVTGATNNYDAVFVGGGNVGIGTATPVAPLEVKGSGTGATIAKFTDTNTTGCTLATGGTIACSSDERLKKNIEDINYGLDTVMSLRPVLYNWKYENNGVAKSLGFIAQEVEALVPKLVSTDESGMKSLNTTGIIPVLTKAIQELNLNLEGIAGTLTPLSGSPSESFAASFFNNLYNKLRTWLADAGNGIGNIFANVFNAKEKICVDGECLTKEDIRALLLLAHPESVVGGGDDSAPSPKPLPEPTPEPIPDPEITPEPENTIEPVPEAGSVVDISPAPESEPVP